MSADTIKELHIQRDKWIEAAIKQQSRAKRAEASLASSHEEIARLREALEAGRQLANVAYNIGQLGHVTDAGSLRSLKEAQLAWDDALTAARALASKTGAA